MHQGEGGDFQLDVGFGRRRAAFVTDGWFPVEKVSLLFCRRVGTCPHTHTHNMLATLLSTARNLS
jgi:hypothetical protein